MNFVSIDPGEKGAIVSWVNNAVVDIVNNPYKNKRIDVDQLKEILTEYNPELLILENVHTAGRRGVVGAGNFMYGQGAIRGLAAGLKINTKKLNPQRWKNLVGLYGKPKSRSLDVVMKLYPRTYSLLIEPSKNPIDRAEAVLMGEAHLRSLKYNL